MIEGEDIKKGYIHQFEDFQENPIFPVTVTDAVVDPNTGKTIKVTLDEEIEHIEQEFQNNEGSPSDLPDPEGSRWARFNEYERLRGDGLKYKEDLFIDSNDEVKLADRDNTDGMGYVILRKNKSFAEQVIKENTIYEIRYDFNLNALEVNIPHNCILKFEGGTIFNGTITGDNTKIDSNIENIFGIDLNINGIWSLGIVYPEWFGAKGDGNHDDSDAVNKVLDFNKSDVPIKILFTNPVYLLDKSINISNRYNICLEGTSKNVLKKVDGCYNDLIIAGQADTIIIKNLTFDGSYTDWNIVIPESSWVTYQYNCCIRGASETTNVIFDNCIVKNFNYGIFLGGAYESHKPRKDGTYTTEFITITNSRFELIKNAAIDTYNQIGLYISNNFIKNCGAGAPAIAIEPSQKRNSLTVSPFSLDTIKSSFALSDCVTVSNNIIYNDNSTHNRIGIKLFSGVIKASIINNTLFNVSTAIEAVDPVIVSIENNVIKNCRIGITAWGYSGIVDIIRNKIFDAYVTTITISKSNIDSIEALNINNNIFCYSENPNITSSPSYIEYANCIVSNNVFKNVNINNSQYGRRAALYFYSIDKNVKVFNNILVKTKDEAVPYFINFPKDTDFISINSKIYDNVSEQLLTNYQDSSTPNVSGPTAYRPNSKKVNTIGYTYFDTTLGKPVYIKSISSDGIITWVDSTGQIV